MSKRQMSKTEKNIARSTATVAIIVLLGKLIGFAREALIAAYYGATPETDAFFFANSMPAMLFPAVCSGISTAFLSLYVKRMEERGIAEGDRYASVMLGLTSLLGLALGLSGVLFSPVLVPLLAPGFSGAPQTSSMPSAAQNARTKASSPSDSAPRRRWLKCAART